MRWLPGACERLMLPLKQRGAALLMLLVIILLGAAYAVMGGLSATALKIERQNKTTEALALAKEALIGYAASANISTTRRPGDLPCPDINDDGVAETNCGNATGSTGQNLRLGRLPWKSLGLSDLWDGSGERLWYAVSNNFKNNTRTKCTTPGMAGCLNSDTSGTITVRDSSGTIVNDGSNSTGAIAVLIAPGSPLIRQDGVNQIRDSANANNPVNYLDIGNGEDNASFVDSHLDGFINTGILRNASGNIIANDQVLAITYENLLPLLEKRVAHEAFNCLKDYAADPLNKGRLPWAADMTASAGGSYADTTDTRFGRLPDAFIHTIASSAGSPMKNGWTTSCNLNLGTWWNNWREIVFYAVAEAYKPASIPPLPSCGICLTVSPPSAAADKRFAVFMAGRRLSGISGGQPRSTLANKGFIGNYLEDQNATPNDALFSKTTSSTIFNDYVLYQ
jgi:hypothetical protein